MTVGDFNNSHATGTTLEQLTYLDGVVPDDATR